MHDMNTRLEHMVADIDITSKYAAELDVDVLVACTTRLILTEPDRSLLTDEFVHHKVMLEAYGEEGGPDLLNELIAEIRIDKSTPAAARKQVDVDRILGHAREAMTHEHNCMNDKSHAGGNNLLMVMLERAGTGNETVMMGGAESTLAAGERQLYAVMKSAEADEGRSGAGEEPAEDPDLRTQAWQILETARIILGRRASRPKRDTLMLADVHMRCLRAPRSPPPAPRRPRPAACAPPERMGS